MNVLAVSTSSKNPSAALMLNDKIHCLVDTSGEQHSVALTRLVDELFSMHNADVNALDLLAVDVGPGSFTGVRIGVSFINALAYSLNIKIVPVSSLSALKQISADPSARILTALDARNGNGYYALFERGKTVVEPSACVLADAEKLIDADTVVIGDCFGRSDCCTAEHVLKEACLSPDSAQGSVQAMYLRPSQAERMKRGE